MKADEFYQHLQDQLNKVTQLYNEIAEAQREFQGKYVTFKADHDRLLNDLVDRRGASLPEPLASQAKARFPLEQEAVAKRIAELDALVAKKQGDADAAIAGMQSEAAGLRALNPQLNDREESLKAMIAFRNQRLLDLNAQVQKLAGGLGFVTQAGKIRTLDNERHKLVGKLEELNTQLAEVRKQWKEKHDSVEADQAQARTTWSRLLVEAGALRSERDALAADPVGQARRRSVFHVLDNLKGLTGADEELQRMIELNVQTDDYQSCLGAVAGMLGVLKGIQEGIIRFSTSLAAIVAEESQHGQYLKKLNVSLPPEIDAFERTWDELLPKVRDEKAIAEHPADFAAAVRPYLDQRLTKESIGSYFDTLGKVIKTATAGWRG